MTAWSTLKLYHEPGHPHKAYSYQVCNVEVIKGNEILKGIRRASARPNDRISMSVGILLNGVCDVNGVPLLGRPESNEVSGRVRAGAVERAGKIISSGAPGAPEGSEDGGWTLQNP